MDAQESGDQNVQAAGLAKAPLHDQQYAYWVTYYDAIQRLTEPYDEIIDKFPSFMSSPIDIRVRETGDGILVIHQKSDHWTFGSVAVGGYLRDIQGFVDVSAPAPNDLDMWVSDTLLEVVDAITGEVMAQNRSDWERLDVVANKEEARWHPLHARMAAQRDVAQAQAKIAADALGATRVVETLRTQISEFESELRSNPPEDVMQRFLEQHSLLLAPSAARVVPKMQLGNQYVTDFVVVESKGEYLFVELESPRQELFTKSGRPRAGLTHAIQQVRDWRAWVRQHHEYAVTSFPGITDPRCVVIIGRGINLSDSDRARLRNLNTEELRTRVMTYDDLVVQASQFADNLEAVAVVGSRPSGPRAPTTEARSES